MNEFDALHEPLKTGNPGGYLPAFTPELAQLVFNGLEPEEVLAFLRAMSLHGSDNYNGEIFYAAWKDIPSVYMIPSIDIIVPVLMQETMVERAAKASSVVERVLVEGAAHGVPVSQLELVIAELVKMAQRQS
ncbi:Alpha/beta hydrolase fold-1 [Penicillium argentinense]|uniref:Alpha/beta hydrolase fold-1 n=1 Tax=Penicillium argentinense TaxID=1131581 RepID=A0A9W9FD18_9EURO|nr:Alpha/beta hydrolase fold-1 [Penicillium argentinense]KAJ5097986.1 Alpha/beta hydrolase fold-1 [Penicillium argentinense]